MLGIPDETGTGSSRVLAWFVRTDLPPREATALEALLDDTELRRSALMPQPRRARFVVAHAALRQIVGGHIGADPRALRWRRGDNGKPHLVGDALAPQVNLTHSGGLAVVAICPPERSGAGRGPRAIGVDIEVLGMTRTAVRMSTRYFQPTEAGFVGATDDPDEQDKRFLRLWTRKEACVKAAGGRLFQGLRLPVGGPGPATGLVVGDPTAALPGPFVVRDIEAPAGSCAAVALEGAGPFQVTTQWWRPMTTHCRPWSEAARPITEEHP